MLAIGVATCIKQEVNSKYKKSQLEIYSQQAKNMVDIKEELSAKSMSQT